MNRRRLALWRANAPWVWPEFRRAAAHLAVVTAQNIGYLVSNTVRALDFDPEQAQRDVAEWWKPQP